MIPGPSLSWPEGLRTPSEDLAKLSDQLGQAWGVSKGETLAQYLCWTERAGLFSALKNYEGASLETLCRATVLTNEATDALLRILLCLKLVRCAGEDAYFLTPLAREYLDQASPYYVGPGLFAGRDPALPPLYLKQRASCDGGARRSFDWPSRLSIQHSRNFAPAVVAARASKLGSLTHLVDIGGGSGVFAIPLALDNPQMRITLVDLPDVLKSIRDFLAAFGVEKRVDLMGLDVLSEPWNFSPCDGILFANFFHSQNDDTCRFLAGKSFDILAPGGTIWLHEVLFDEKRDGPLLAALWNANMLALRPGAKQRTYSELNALLHNAGFETCRMQPTAGHFSLTHAVKPISKHI